MIKNKLLHITFYFLSGGFCIFFTSGCSLITIESASEPLPNREVNARFLTHEYVTRFGAQIEETADSIIAQTSDIEIRLNAIRWKIFSYSAIQTTSFHPSPNASLVDTWAFCAQMADFFKEGNGKNIFGEMQHWVITTCDTLEYEYAELVRSVLPQTQYEGARRFIAGYVPQHPLTDVTFKRESTNPALREYLQLPDSAAITTVGDLPQVMSDFSSRLSLYSQHVPKAVEWNTELLVRDSGFDSLKIQSRLDSLASMIDKISDVAEQSPQIMDSALQSLSYHLRPLLREIDYQRIETLDAISRERALLTDVIVAERANVMADLDQTIKDAVEASWKQARGLVNGILIGLIIFTIVILGVPFALGYIVGKTLGARKKAEKEIFQEG